MKRTRKSSPSIETSDRSFYLFSLRYGLQPGVKGNLVREKDLFTVVLPAFSCDTMRLDLYTMLYPDFFSIIEGIIGHSIMVGIIRETEVFQKVGTRTALHNRSKRFGNFRTFFILIY